MPERDFLLRAVLSTLDDGSYRGRLLLFPEASAYDNKPEDVVRELTRLGEEVLEGLPLAQLYRRRQIAGEVEVREVTIEVPPPQMRNWTTPLPVRFGVVCWSHGSDAMIGYVPALDIEVVVRRPDDLDAQLTEDIRYALMRRKTAASLRALAELQRIESVRVEPVAYQVAIKTPKQLAQKQQPEEESVLSEIASELHRSGLPDVFGLDAVVEALDDWLFGKSPRSVLLVGPSGVGKTAAIHKLATQAGRKGAVARPIWSTSGARIVAGMAGFGMWQERCRKICREAANTNAVIHLGNLMELMQVGRSTGSDLGIGEFLRPAVARGELLAVVECTAEQLARIERASPAMLDAFVRLDVSEPTRDESLAILRQAAKVYSFLASARPDEAALAAVERLHRRYATYSAFPGRPLRFLKNLIADARHPGQEGPSWFAPHGEKAPRKPSGKRRGKPMSARSTGAKKPSQATLTAADVTAAFSLATGLPELLLEETVPLHLPATREWFEQRVIGQTQAVDVVVDLLATVKADLARPDRPLASLLFIGPTGVGKTEMAKSLAEFLYRDRRRMIRIDMSEYADPASIDRLIGTSSQVEGVLTSKVREQPFGVVLFDEFEKAHPRFYDFLLQVLGEGRLTDAAGRLADFRNAVIIMTSNLGAESFGRPAPGFHGASEAGDAVGEHFARHVRTFVRPELYNRIDRIVTFLPLAEEVLLDIARRELQLLRQRDGIRFRNLHVEFSPELAETLVRETCDPRYGARPLKRAVERQVLTPLAAALNERAAGASLHANVTVESGRVRVALRSRGERDRHANANSEDGPPVAVATVELAITCRREAMMLSRSRSVSDVHNELFWLRHAEQRRTTRHTTRRGLAANEWSKESAEDREDARRLQELQTLVDRVDVLAAKAAVMEDDLLHRFYLGQELDDAQILDDLAALPVLIAEVSRDLYLRQFPQPDFVNLVIYWQDVWWSRTLVRAYTQLALSKQYDVQAYLIRKRSDTQPRPPDAILLGDRDSKDPKQRAQANGTRLFAERLTETQGDLTETVLEAIGISLCIRGPQAGLLLRAEEGLHVHQKGNEKARCLLHTSVEAIPQYQPPARIDRRSSFHGQSLRRTYDGQRHSVDDRRLDQRVHWSSHSLDRVILELAEARLEVDIKEWMQP